MPLPHVTPAIGEIPAVVVCPRQEECRRRDEEIKHMYDKMATEKREDHKELWDAIKKTNENVSAVAVTVSGLAGRVVGYTMAGSIIVGVVAFVAAKVFH